MNELRIFLTGVGFSCVVGALVGSILAMSLKRVTGTVKGIALSFGLCVLVIGTAWALCVAVGGRGFVGHVCNLLLAPMAYIGVFTGWTVYSYAMGAVVETGWMAVIAWLVWQRIRTRQMKMGANQRVEHYGA